MRDGGLCRCRRQPDGQTDLLRRGHRGARGPAQGLRASRRKRSPPRTCGAEVPRGASLVTKLRDGLAARRMSRIPPYLFAEIDKKVAAKRAAGVDVIALDIGDPDTPTPGHIVDAARDALPHVENQRYASYFGMPALRQAVAGWYKRCFHVRLAPAAEITPPP